MEINTKNMKFLKFLAVKGFIIGALLTILASYLLVSNNDKTGAHVLFLFAIISYSSSIVRYLVIRKKSI